MKEVDVVLMALFGVMMRNLSWSFSGPGSEIEMSQKVKGHLSIAEWTHSFTPWAWPAACCTAGWLQERVLKFQPLHPEEPANISEMFVPILGTILSKGSVWKQRGKSLCFNESFHSEIYVEEIWLLNPDFLLA